MQLTDQGLTGQTPAQPESKPVPIGTGSVRRSGRNRKRHHYDLLSLPAGGHGAWLGGCLLGLLLVIVVLVFMLPG